MAPENTSATPTTETEEQPKQRVSVSDERKAHPSSANARRMSSAAKTAPVPSCGPSQAKRNSTVPG